MEYSQVVRQRTLTPPFGGSSPPTPVLENYTCFFFIFLGTWKAIKKKTDQFRNKNDILSRDKYYNFFRQKMTSSIHNKSIKLFTYIIVAVNIN